MKKKDTINIFILKQDKEKIFSCVWKSFLKKKEKLKRVFTLPNCTKENTIFVKNCFNKRLLQVYKI